MSPFNDRGDLSSPFCLFHLLSLTRYRCVTDYVLFDIFEVASYFLVAGETPLSGLPHPGSVINLAPTAFLVLRAYAMSDNIVLTMVVLVLSVATPATLIVRCVFYCSQSIVVVCAQYLLSTV